MWWKFNFGSFSEAEAYEKHDNGESFHYDVPCMEYKNASMILMLQKHHFPMLVLLFDTIADERCQNGTISREQI